MARSNLLGEAIRKGRRTEEVEKIGERKKDNGGEKGRDKRSRI